MYYPIIRLDNIISKHFDQDAIDSIKEIFKYLSKYTSFKNLFIGNDEDGSRIWDSSLEARFASKFDLPETTIITKYDIFTKLRSIMFFLFLTKLSLLSNTKYPTYIISRLSAITKIEHSIISKILCLAEQISYLKIKRLFDVRSPLISVILDSELIDAKLIDDLFYDFKREISKDVLRYTLVVLFNIYRDMGENNIESRIYAMMAGIKDLDSLKDFLDKQYNQMILFTSNLLIS